MHKTLALLAVGVSFLAAAPAHGAGGFPAKKLNCYVYFSVTPTYTGRHVTFKSATTYKWFNGKATKAGTYKRAGAKVSFKTGPLKGKTGERRVYGNGKVGVNIQMKAGKAGSYVCS